MSVHQTQVVPEVQHCAQKKENHVCKMYHVANQYCRLSKSSIVFMIKHIKN